MDPSWLEFSASTERQMSLAREDLLGSNSSDVDRMPEDWTKYNFKSYPRFGERISFDMSDGSVCWENSLACRKSFRDFRMTDDFAFCKMAPALRCATKTSLNPTPHRPYPSAGGRFCTELYLIALEVHGLESGIYYVDCFSAQLIKLFDCNGGNEIVSAFGETEPTRAPATFVYTILPYRSAVKYGNRGHRYAYLEAGAFAQSVDLSLTAHGFKTLWVGGFADRELADLIGVEPELEGEYPVIAQCVAKV